MALVLNLHIHLYTSKIISRPFLSLSVPSFPVKLRPRSTSTLNGSGKKVITTEKGKEIYPGTDPSCTVEDVGD